MHRPQIQSAKVGPFLAVLGLLLAAWFSVPQTASAACLPQDHNDLFAATLSPGGHLENSSLPPENCVWENFENSNETTPADELNSLQLRWESHFGELENASGVLSYADGNPISLSDPSGLCAGINVCTGGYGTGNGSVPKPQWMINLGEGIDNAISEISYNMPPEALSPNPAMFFESAGLLLARGSQAAKVTDQLAQTEFAFARGASIQNPGVTQAGEAFVRVRATEASTGVRVGSYAMP